MKVQVINKSDNELPRYETGGSSGLDLRANIPEDIVLGSLKRVLVPTGLFLSIPEGMEGQIRPKRGVSSKRGLTVLNSPGTVDSDHRGEVCVLLVNLSRETVTISKNERIAQIVFSKVERIEWEVCDELDKTKRGEGGFGSTGTQ
nr:deoxyuridine 5 triphosphate nucleotido hydrolase [Marseillevirus futianmevirus]